MDGKGMLYSPVFPKGLHQTSSVRAFGGHGPAWPTQPISALFTLSCELFIYLQGDQLDFIVLSQETKSKRADFGPLPLLAH
jgi:hypothetical protein